MKILKMGWVNKGKCALANEKEIWISYFIIMIRTAKYDNLKKKNYEGEKSGSKMITCLYLSFNSMMSSQDLIVQGKMYKQI